MRRGFTLIELLIVVTIVGILAAIVYSNTKGATFLQKNCKARCENSGATTWSYGPEGCYCGGSTR